MPYEIKEHNGQHCVFKKGEGSPMKGGCHSDHGDAVNHLRALYANEKRSMSYLASSAQFSEGDNLLWIEALPAKTWFDPRYGEVPVTQEKLQRFVKNFNTGVRGQKVMSDYEHGIDPAKGKKASGEFKKMEIRAQDDSTPTLYVGIEPTPTALNEIQNGEWRYFSLDWEDYWIHPETQQIHEDVVIGGALTNRPVAKGMAPINFSEVVNTDDLFEYLPEAAKEPGSGLLDHELPQDDSTGSRIDTVHSDTEPGGGGYGSKDTVTSPHGFHEGGVEMNEEQLKLLREHLGLAEDADVDAVLSSAKTLSENMQNAEKELEPLRELEKAQQERKKFAEMYPEEAKELEESRKDRQQRFAKQFAESLEGRRVIRKSGTGDAVTEENTTLGLSALALDGIEACAKEFSEGKPTFDTFKNALDAIFDNGIVDYGNKGSERKPENDELEVPGVGTPAARKMFGEKVSEIMEEDKLDSRAALVEAAKRFPQLAEAWRGYSAETSRA